MQKNNFVITIGRQFGCGGREIGKALARKLGVRYYDKELLEEASHKTGVCREFFESVDEKTPNFFDSIFSYNLGYLGASFMGFSTPASAENIYAAQSNVIKELAHRESCVIVGRSADYVLRNHPCLISVFIHSDINDRVNRILSRNECKDVDSAKQLAEKKDKMRAGYYNFYTDRLWGYASSYNITIDSSALEVEDIVEIIADFAKKHINKVCKSK